MFPTAVLFVGALAAEPNLAPAPTDAPQEEAPAPPEGVDNSTPSKGYTVYTPEPPKAPRVSPTVEREIGQKLWAGTLFGVLGGLGTSIVTYGGSRLVLGLAPEGVDTSSTGELQATLNTAVLVSLPVGYALGASLGVTRLGAHYTHAGKFGPTLGGAVAGAALMGAAGWGIASLTPDDATYEDRLYALVLSVAVGGALGSAGGAVLGYELSDDQRGAHPVSLRVDPLLGPGIVGLGVGGSF